MSLESIAIADDPYTPVDGLLDESCSAQVVDVESHSVTSISILVTIVVAAPDPTVGDPSAVPPASPSTYTSESKTPAVLSCQHRISSACTFARVQPPEGVDNSTQLLQAGPSPPCMRARTRTTVPPDAGVLVPSIWM